MKHLRRGLFSLLLLTLLLTLSKPSKAAETNPDWYKEYDYFLMTPIPSMNVPAQLHLKSYQGSDTVIYVPAYTTIDGVTYRTYLQHDCIWDNVKRTVTQIQFEEGCKVVNATSLFEGLEKLQTVNVEVLDFSENTSLAFAFNGCKSLTKLDVSNMNTSKVTSMTCAFSGCSKLKTVDASNWDTKCVTDISFLFSGCSTLDTLDLHKWDTRNVTDMMYAFSRCDHLRKLNVKGWNTQKVTKIGGLFMCCYSLESLDLSSFDLSKIQLRKQDNTMLLRCNSLRSIKTPKRLKKNHPIDSTLSYRKKGSSKTYQYLPKGSKSVTLYCTVPKGKTPTISNVKKSGTQITVSWKKPATSASDSYDQPQYEVQCSDSKDFTGTCGALKKRLKDTETISVEGDVVGKNSAAITKLEKGKTYYIRVRAIYRNASISDWSKVKKVKM